MTDIPTTMRRLVVTEPGKDVASCKIEIEEDVPVPQPAAGQVLIKVVAAAINPSDYSSWYRCKPEDCPYPMGKEGSGIVVKVGSGLMAGLSSPKVGSKVGFINVKNKQGAYSEYVVANVMGECFGMPDNLPIEDAASFFINPYTAVGILDVVKREGCRAFVHTAAASQLGQMIVKLAPTEGMDVINVVRRDDQAEMLKKLGAKHVVVSSCDDESWKDDLKAKIKELDTTVAFDAVAGKSTSDILNLLPDKGTVYVYGGLAGPLENIDPTALIYHQKIVKGFYLSAWMMEGGILSKIPRILSTSRKVNGGLAGGWSSTQFKDTTLEKAHEDIVALLGSSASGQKLRIRFDM